ncbi:MAG: hypothetical protein RBQ97_01475 [Acholeplasma sp.]|nr:hypothetical protein [Acholeplasma sp.]
MRKESLIDYREFIVSEELLKMLNKGKNKQYSVFAPFSRQEKGIDLILFNRISRKSLSIQVKSSKSYVDGNNNDIKHNFLWLNKFNISNEAYADYYVIMGNYINVKYEKLIEQHGMSINAIDYKPIILIYTYNEMVEELQKLRLKTKDNTEKFFSFKFRNEDDITLDRGYVSGYNTLNNGSAARKSHLTKNKIHELIDALN